MEVLVQWFSHHLAQFISPEGAVFIISMITDMLITSLA